jgi:hypothetical protein
MSEKHFIHFGCWNKGHSTFREGDTETASALTNVMRRLNYVSDEINPEFIVVAGDNYYPNKTVIENKNKKEKLKSFDESDLISGFDSLPKNVELDVIMGNHDYETELYLPSQDIIETSCTILKTEYDLTYNYANLNILMYKARKFGQNTLVLMIDTTIYDNKYAQKIINCYKLHPDFSNENPTIENVRRNQSEFIKKNILENIDTLKNLIIVGHHPITGYKLKKGNKTELINSPGKPFVDSLYNDAFRLLIGKEVNYYYLCADLHQYQIGNISIEIEGSSEKMMIKQYIAGTGGADPDAYPFINKEDMEEVKIDTSIFEILPNDGNNVVDDGIKYKITYLMTPEELALSGSMFGILQCDGDANGDKLSFKFINTDGQEFKEDNPTEGLRLISQLVGGRKGKKTKKNKTHKKTLKKTKKNKRRKTNNRKKCKPKSRKHRKSIKK